MEMVNNTRIEQAAGKTLKGFLFYSHCFLWEELRSLFEQNKSKC